MIHLDRITFDGSVSFETGQFISGAIYKLKSNHDLEQ